MNLKNIFTGFILFISGLQVSAQEQLIEGDLVVRDFCFSKDYDKLYVPCGDRLEILSVPDFKVIDKVTYPEPERIITVALNVEGKSVLLGSADSSLIVINLEGDKPTEIKKQNFLLTKIRFSPEGKRLAMADSRQRIIMYSAPDMARARELTDHRSDVTDIEFISEEVLASCDAEGRIILWNLKTGEIITEWAGPGKWLRSLQYNPDNLSLTACGDRGRLTSWDISDLTNPVERNSYYVSTDWLMSCDVLNENIFAAGGAGMKVKVYTGIGRYKINLRTTINKLAFLPGKGIISLLAATEGKGLLFIRTDQMKLIK